MTVGAKYLSLASREQRIETLIDMKKRGEFLPISLARDLLDLELSVKEHAGLISVANSADQLALENFLTENLHRWDQDLAVAALTEWSTRTDRLLWFRIPVISATTLLPQRVRYSMINLANTCGGRLVLKVNLKIDGLNEFSPAYHSLLLQRLQQWNIEEDAALKLARKCLANLNNMDFSLQKSVPAALCYLARYSPSDLDQSVIRGHQYSESWRPLIQSINHVLASGDDFRAPLAKFLAKPPKTKAVEKFVSLWPPIFMRHLMESDLVAQALTFIVGQSNSKASAESQIDWQYFGGCREEVLREAILKIDSPEHRIAACNFIDGLLSSPKSPEVLESLRSAISGSQTPAELLQKVNGQIREQMKRIDGIAPIQQQLINDEQTCLRIIEQAKGSSSADIHWSNYTAQVTEKKEWIEDAQELSERNRFFDIAYRGKIGLEPIGKGYWAKLADAWQKPQIEKLNDLAGIARQAPAVFQFCYINTLGRFAHMDQSALKLLDYVRTQEEDQLYAVIHAFAGIGSPRALQELVSALTRPNLTLALQMEICALLREQDLSKLQSDLRSAITDLSTQGGGESKRELLESLQMLLHPDEQTAEAAGDSIANPPAKLDIDLDKSLRSKIPNYSELSSEVRRALRTAEFFHLQVNNSPNKSTIDLSPVIDMQYKALELLFREIFETPCNKLINTGILQRKLDVLGYARPIPALMDQFENYIGSQPVISNIPFFSKFKLRKMLRALCQFRPGKRFTLDGVKAFAIFFLCFSRKRCSYGLNDLFPLPFTNDEELFNFVKLMHVFQDFRNRAAHEGFQPEARNDIESIWQSTAEIVGNIYKIKAFLEREQGNAGGNGYNQRDGGRRAV